MISPPPANLRRVARTCDQNRDALSTCSSLRLPPTRSADSPRSGLASSCLCGASLACLLGVGRVLTLLTIDDRTKWARATATRSRCDPNATAD
nr:unnamed protein product [Callosobruchus chinensis]